MYFLLNDERKSFLEYIPDSCQYIEEINKMICYSNDLDLENYTTEELIELLSKLEENTKADIE